MPGAGVDRTGAPAGFLLARGATPRRPGAVERAHAEMHLEWDGPGEVNAPLALSRRADTRTGQGVCNCPGDRRPEVPERRRHVKGSDGSRSASGDMSFAVSGLRGSNPSHLEGLPPTPNPVGRAIVLGRDMGGTRGQPVARVLSHRPGFRRVPAPGRPRAVLPAVPLSRSASRPSPTLPRRLRQRRRGQASRFGVSCAPGAYPVPKRHLTPGVGDRAVASTPGERR
jgi:hypothetical protein